MRCLLLAVVAGLAFLAAGIRAEEQTGDVIPVEDIDPDVLTQMLGDLFGDDEFIEGDAAIAREGRSQGGEAETSAVEDKSAVDPKDQARMNAFIDTFFRRLNSYARSRFDPLSVGLVKKKASAKKERKGAGKKGKKGGKKKNKSGKNKKGGKKKGRHPKDLDLDEVAQEEHEEEVDVEEESHDISKREVEVIDFVEIEEEEDEEIELEEEEDEVEEESLVRVARDVQVEEEEEESEDSTLQETSRKGKPAKGGKKGKGKGKKGAKRGGKKGKGGKKKSKKAAKKGAKKGGKQAGKKGKSKRSAKNKGPRTSRASVSGIATLKREGDVSVKNHKGGKEMKARFTLGPVDLKVKRKFGTGKKAIVREARAVSPELTGKLSIQVAQNGKARLTNFWISRPAIVQVEGNLRKSTKGGKTDNNFIENSISRFSPVAAKKLKIASREILSAGEPKANSDA